MAIRERLRKLEKATSVVLVEIELEDGTVARFPEEVVFPEAFLYETSRWKANNRGEPVPPCHPLVEALRKAKDLETLMSEHGTLLGMYVGEDAVIRGELERRAK